MHADHITGTGAIKKMIKTCKRVIAKTTPAMAVRYVVDGEIIKFGKFSLECRSTPGHTDGMDYGVWMVACCSTSGQTRTVISTTVRIE